MAKREKVDNKLFLKPWRETLTTTAIIGVMVILVLLGILVWAALFFRAKL